ncbi:MAG: hypothetical protein ACRDHD_10055 [Candidatus Limnocylindria bacterium]
MTHTLRTRLRRLAGLLTLAGTLILALSLPIPTLPDDGRAAVARAIDERLPGWAIERIDPSWEGAYTVVTRCAGHEMGFQLVPGHGLPARDAWLQPNDAYARERLADLSDHWRYLIWYDDPALLDTLSCREELAQRDSRTIEGRIFD